MSTFKALIESRKVWAALFALLGVAVATYLRSIDRIPADALLPVIVGIASLGTVYMGAVASEDIAKTRALLARADVDPNKVSPPGVTPPVTKEEKEKQET